MPNPPPLRLLRSRSTSISGLPRSQPTSSSGFPRTQSTSTSGLPRDDGLQDQPAVNATMWKPLDTVFILFVGTVKTISAFRGQPVAPDAIDWIIGVL